MRSYPDLNFPEFERVATMLREDGYDIHSPHEHGEPTWARGKLMTDDLIDILTTCDGVVLLSNWRESPGACAEVATAYATEKPVYEIEYLGEMGQEPHGYQLVPCDAMSVTVVREEQYANKIPLIGLGGFAQSGKDTAAQVLVDAGWTRVAFADTLRDMLYALNPAIHLPVTWKYDELHSMVDAQGWDSAKMEFPMIRDLLQRLGTEAGRDILDPDIWVHKGEEKIEHAADLETPVVITDMRFQNELRMIRRRGGKLVWVERPGIGPVNSHASEHSITKEDCDVVLWNGGTIEDLAVQVKELMK
jgi:hypothetical protein